MKVSIPEFELYFGDLPNPRRDNGRLRHKLIGILAIALCAMLGGAESFVGMEEYGESKQRWLRECLGLPLRSCLKSVSDHILAKLPALKFLVSVGVFGVAIKS